MAKQRINLSLSPDAVAAFSDLAEANSTTISGLLERLAALLAVRTHACDLNPNPKPYHRRPRAKRVAPDRTFSAECGNQ
jgi:hypothetical protein